MRIERNHALGKDEAKRRVDKIRSGVEATYGLSSSWDGDDLRVSGTGVTGKISVSEQRLLVDVKLGFAMMMMEGAIRSHISAALDEHLA